MAAYNLDFFPNLPLVHMIPSSGTQGMVGTLGGLGASGVTNTGTISHPTVTQGSSDPALGSRRTRFSSAGTAGATAGISTIGFTNVGTFSNDGFHATVTFSKPSQPTVLGESMFIGFCAQTSVLNGNPSALVNMVGIGYDATDALTSDYFLYVNDGTGTATKIQIVGLNRVSSAIHAITLSIRALEGSIQVYVKDSNTGKTFLQNVMPTTDLPTSNTLLAFKAEVYNGAVAQVSALDMHRVLISTRG